MTKPSQSGFKRFFYNQNIKRDKSGKKYKNLINHYILLIKRVEKNGMDARLLDALSKAKKKIIAYGIALYQIEAIMKQRGLERLIELFQSTFGGAIKKHSSTSKSTQTKAPVKKVVKEAKEKNIAPKEKTAKKAPVKKESKSISKTTEKKVNEKKAPVKKVEKETNTKKSTEKKAVKAKTTK